MRTSLIALALLTFATTAYAAAEQDKPTYTAIIKAKPIYIYACTDADGTENIYLSDRETPEAVEADLNLFEEDNYRCTR